jgi:hypothetical protein
MVWHPGRAKNDRLWALAVKPHGLGSRLQVFVIVVETTECLVELALVDRREPACLARCRRVT